MRRAHAAALAAIGVAGTIVVSSAQTQRPRATAQPRSEVAVPFRVGETLTFDVAWSSYLVAGSATATVVEKKPSYNSTAYYIVAEGRPLPLIQRLYQLYYKMDTLVDVFTSLTQRSSLYTEEGTSRKMAATRFDRPAKRALYELQGEGSVKDEFAVPADVQDGLSTLYALRTRAFRAGERFTIPVADDGTLYSVGFEVSGPEQMRMRVGTFDAWKLGITITDPKRQAVGKNIAVWISNDARRLPLKLQADLPVGDFALALREAR